MGSDPPHPHKHTHIHSNISNKLSARSGSFKALRNPFRIPDGSLYNPLPVPTMRKISCINSLGLLTFHLFQGLRNPGALFRRSRVRTMDSKSSANIFGIEIAMDEHFDFRELFVHTIFEVREMSSLYLYLHNLPLCSSFPQMFRHTFPNN